MTATSEQGESEATIDGVALMDIFRCLTAPTHRDTVARKSNVFPFPPSLSLTWYGTSLVEFVQYIR